MAFVKAVATEKGRRTLFAAAGSKRRFAMEERRDDGLLDLGGGDRPAGLRTGAWALTGADLGVDGGALRAMCVRGVRGWSIESKAVREVFDGLEGSLRGSSSSQTRFRLVVSLRVNGLMFFVSISAIGRFL